MQHTAGEWKPEIAKSGNDTFGFRITADGRKPPICHLGTYERETAIVSSDFRRLCPEYFLPEELEANARLIAAAPDILAAMKRLLSLHEDAVFINGSGDDTAVNAALKWCYAVIGKAESKQNPIPA